MIAVTAPATRRSPRASGSSARKNVDSRSGEVRRDRVIFSWITNAGYAASFRGRVILMDTYINRFEVPPVTGPDLRRTPFGAQDLVDLHPEAIFLGTGMAIMPTMPRSSRSGSIFRSIRRPKPAT